MQFKNLALLALSGTAIADFVIITHLPTPTNLADLTNIASYASSLENYVESHLATLTASSLLAAASSAHAGLASFAATASYSIPAEVTAVSALETFTTVPAWYSALPSDVKSYYDKYNAEVQSVLDDAAGGANATSTSGTSGSATGSAVKATGTGAASEKVVGGMGLGVAALLAGLMAL